MESIPHVFIELKSLETKKQLFGKLSIDERLNKKDDLMNINNQLLEKWEQCRLVYINLDSKARDLVKNFKITKSYLVLFNKLDQEFPLELKQNDFQSSELVMDFKNQSSGADKKYQYIVDLIDKWLGTFNDNNKDKIFRSLVSLAFKKNYFDQKKFIDKDNSRIIINLLKIIREVNLTHNLNQNLIYRNSILNICNFFPSITFEDQSEYHGEYVGNKLDGFGVLIEKKYKAIYIGEFEENNFCGFGLQIFDNGDFYYGEFKEDSRDGFGRYTWADRESYTGYWKKGEQVEELSMELDIDQTKEDNSLEFQKKQFIQNLPSFDIMIEQFKAAHDFNFKILETNNEKLNYLIQLITLDNRISFVERKFLIEKTRELNLSIELLKEAEEYLETNNPFLDKIFELIFNDGTINKNELEFIHEKTLEFGHFVDQVNDRFWSYAIHFNLNDLLKISEFKEWIFIWYLNTNFIASQNPLNTKDCLNIFSGTDLNLIISDNHQKINNINIDVLGFEVTLEEFIQRQISLKKEVKIDLSLISPLHKDALCWFSINKEKTVNYTEISGEKRFNSGNIFLFNSAKGIHKPRTESFVLSIKVLLNSAYNDKIDEIEGSWNLKYHKEDGNEWTNEGLIKCMESKVPIGVFYQIKSPPTPIYRVYGLGLIHSYDGTFFYISEILETDYNIFNWDPELKAAIPNESHISSINNTGISKDNIYLKFSKIEQGQIISLMNKMEYIPASNLFLDYAFKYGLNDYKKISKYFDELEISFN
jgi:hypothetical protein